jgi:hypothetical protein
VGVIRCAVPLVRCGRSATTGGDGIGDFHRRERSATGANLTTCPDRKEFENDRSPAGRLLGGARFRGYLLPIVSNLGADASELLILDASALSQIAAVELPRRVPRRDPRLLDSLPRPRLNPKGTL